MEYEKILEFTENDTVKLAQTFKDEIGRSMSLGMTAYQCEFGTLSDGHEKITPSQRYYQAVKEMWYIGNSISDYKASAMEFQADLIEAEEELKNGFELHEKLRAEAKVLRAKTKLSQALVHIQDSMRCLKAFDKVRRELKESVEAQYPEGIEQSELDNWTAVAEYRSSLRQFGQNVNLTHIPLPQDVKAKVGMDNNAPDMAAWLLVDKKKEIMEKTRGDFKAYLSHLKLLK